LQEDRPTSNPLPPQSVAFVAQRREPSLSAQEVLDKVAQETPNFGTEQACSILLFLLGQKCPVYLFCYNRKKIQLVLYLTFWFFLFYFYRIRPIVHFTSRQGLVALECAAAGFIFTLINQAHC